MQRLHFEQVVDGLWSRALGDRVTPQLKGKLKELGLDLDAQLLPAYPAEKMHVWVTTTAATLYPQLSHDEGLERLGEDFFRGFTSTLIGQAMKAMMRVIGTRRSLQRMERNFRTGNNYMETRLTSLGSGDVELWIKDVNGVPGYYAGMVRAGGDATGARDIQVTWKLAGETGALYRVSWAE